MVLKNVSVKLTDVAVEIPPRRLPPENYRGLSQKVLKECAYFLFAVEMGREILLTCFVL